MAVGCHFEKLQKWPYIGNGFIDWHEVWQTDVPPSTRTFV